MFLLLLLLLLLTTPEAGGLMVKGHTDCLHKCVHNGWATEREAPILHVFAQLFADRCAGWHGFHGGEGVEDGLAVGQEGVEVGEERTVLLLDLQDLLGVHHCTPFIVVEGEKVNIRGNERV